MIRTALWGILSHWWRHPGQCLALITGLALATALWSGVQAINAEARASYDRAAAMLGQDNLTALVAPAGKDIPLEAYTALRRGGWLVTPVMEGTLRRGETRLTLLGIDPLTRPPGLGGAPVFALEDLDQALGTGVLYADAETAARLEGQDLPPIRVSATAAPGTIITDISTASRLLETTTLSRLLVLPDQPKRRAALDDLAPDLLERAPETSGDMARLTDSFHLNLTAFGFLSFAVGLFIVHGTIGLAFEQRRAVFRTLRAVGLPARSLALALGIELLGFALIGGLIGVALGYVIAGVLLPDVAATLSGLYGASVAGTLAIRPEWWAAGLALAGLGTLTAGVSALGQAFALPILASARPRAWALANSRTRRFQLGAAAMLLLAAIGLAIWGGGLVKGFGILAAILLAAALLLPTCLDIMLGIGSRLARRPLAQWFWADTRQQVPGLSLALMALLLALAANVGVGTMVKSFRATFTGWLDQRLAAELYVTARDDAEGRALRAWLAPRTDAVLPIWHVDGTLGGRAGEIFGVVDHATYRDHWPILESVDAPWDRLAEGGAAFLNEQLARRAGLRPGDTVTLEPGWDATVVAVYSDYGNPAGQAIVRLRDLEARHPDLPRLNHGIRVAKEEVAPLRLALTEEFGLPSSQVVDQAGIKDFSLAVFDRTFAVSAALNVLTLGVAGIAILTALLTLAAIRLPQLAPVWALGVERRTLALAELGRALALAALTFAVALPLGLIFAWLLLAVINVEAFGWRLPMQLFPMDWLRLLALALVAATIAAALPARRLARTPPAVLAKVFADER